MTYKRNIILTKSSAAFEKVFGTEKPTSRPARDQNFTDWPSLNNPLA